VTLAEAVDTVADSSDARIDPAISNEEIQAILARCIVVRPFAASSAFAAGEWVVPAGTDLEASGATLYQIVAGGISGSSTPIWPTSQGAAGRTRSGNVTIALLGVFDGSQWDVTEATRLALKRKIARCAQHVDSRDKDTSESLSQMRAGYERALAALGPSWGRTA
jgi:hypothetical protein